MLRAFPTVPAFWKPEIGNPLNCAESLIDVVAVVGEIAAPPRNVSLRSVIWLDAKAYGVACAVPPSPAKRPRADSVTIRRGRAGVGGRGFMSVCSGCGQTQLPASGIPFSKIGVWRAFCAVCSLLGVKFPDA